MRMANCLWKLRCISTQPHESLQLNHASIMHVSCINHTCTAIMTLCIITQYFMIRQASILIDASFFCKITVLSTTLQTNVLLQVDYVHATFCNKTCQNQCNPNGQPAPVYRHVSWCNGTCENSCNTTPAAPQQPPQSHLETAASNPEVPENTVIARYYRNVTEMNPKTNKEYTVSLILHCCSHAIHTFALYSAVLSGSG